MRKIVCLHVRYVYAKIAYLHVYTQSMHVTVVSMNAHNLRFILNIFTNLFLLKCIIIIFANLHVTLLPLKYFVYIKILCSHIDNKSKVDSFSISYKTRWVVVRKYVICFVVRHEARLSGYKITLFTNINLSNLVEHLSTDTVKK